MTDEAIPVGERLRPDPELQRLGDRLERAARHFRLSGEERGAVAHPPGAAGRGARVSAAARSRIPPRAQGAPDRGRETDSSEAESAPAATPAGPVGWLRCRLLRRRGRPAGTAPIG